MKIINIASLFTVALLLCNCSGKKADSAETTEEIPTVKVEKVSSREVEQLSTFTATVEPEIINNISASMSNRIKQIYVDEGMRVNAGQKLVLLDDVNTTSFEAQVDNARANLKLAQTNLERAKQLLAIGGGTQQAVDQMEIQYTNARNALTTAERSLRNARENTVLTSPISGVVTARNYDPGDMTGQLPILTVARVQPIKAIINVSESDFSNVKKGMPVSLTFQTYGDEIFEGRISMISPTIDTATRTFGVEITCSNKDERILPGMFGRATLNLGLKNHVVVPDKSVVKQPGSGNCYVYVYSDGKVSYNRVELGQRLGDFYELLSGVEDGAEVVVAGQTGLSDGAKVRISD